MTVFPGSSICSFFNKVCAFPFQPILSSSPSPKLGPKSNIPPPPAEPQLLHSGVATCIGRRIQLSRPAALLQDPLAPLPPPPCIRTPLAALYRAAALQASFSAVVHRPRVPVSLALWWF